MHEERAMENGADILLVEDNPADAEFALAALNQCGFGSRVAHVSDGAEALDYIAATGPFARSRPAVLPRLILLDLGLQKMSGLHVLRQLKSDEAKKEKVAAWIEEGLKLSEIQNRLASELGVTLTYMEVRLLVNDLKLTPKDQPTPQPATQISSGSAGSEKNSPPQEMLDESFPEELAAESGAPSGVAAKISVSRS